MAKSKKQKYAASREMQSDASKENQIAFHHYTTVPKLDIFINKDLPGNVINDLKHAVDDVLKYHGL